MFRFIYVLSYLCIRKPHDRHTHENSHMKHDEIYGRLKTMPVHFLKILGGCGRPCATKALSPHLEDHHTPKMHSTTLLLE